MKKKTIIYIIVFIILILMAVFLTYQLVEIRNNKGNNALNIVLNNSNNTNNMNNTVNNIVNNIIENNVITNTIDEEAVDNETVQTNVSNIEKAIEIVQNNWGVDDTVYFSYDEKNPTNSKGEYVICVRDKQTTYEKYWYYVNIDSGTFTIE